MEKKINNLEEEMIDQSKKLNKYHKLLTEEMNKNNDEMIRDTERIHNLNDFKNNIDNFINVFSKDIQYDLKNLEKKIISSCQTHFLSKEELFPKNKEYEQQKPFLQKELEHIIKENIEK